MITLVGIVVVLTLILVSDYKDFLLIIDFFGVKLDYMELYYEICPIKIFLRLIIST